MRARRVKTPLVLQMEMVECGAAALAIAMGYHGRFIPLSQLREDCGVSRDGSKASNLLKAAKLHGFTAKGFSKSVEDLKKLDVPCIVYWQFNHFLVVEGFAKDRVYLNDPAMGHRQISLDEFDRGFTGVVLTLEPGPEFEKCGKQPSALPALKRRIKTELPGFRYIAVAGFLLVVPTLAIAGLTRIFLDEILTEQKSTWFRPFVLAMLATLVVQVVLEVVRNHILRRLKIGLSARFNTDFLRHLLKLPVRFYAQRYPGEIANRMNLNDKVSDVLAGQLATTTVEICTMIFFGAILLTYNVPLTLIGIGSAVFCIWLLWRVSSARTEANMRLAKEEGMVFGTAIAGIQSMETLKAANMEAGLYDRWSGYFANAMNSGQKLEITTNWMITPANFAKMFASVLILIFGSFYIISGEMTVGMLVAFLALMAHFLSPITSMMSLGSSIQELQGDVLRLDDVLAAESVVSNDHSDKSLDEIPVRSEGWLSLKGLTFGYSPLEKPLIDQFDLEIRPGERVALVGGSGSGKSTVAKIVCGLYEPWSGEVRIDGIPLADIPGDVLRNSLGMVEQEIFVFEGTVRENLTLWDRTVPERTLIEACQDASILNDLLKLNGGLDSLLAEGATNLSGGQRQRLEIARALVNNPSVLVLDEATSALDTATEMTIDQNLRRRGCTCLIVAHRLSTIRDCDQILVMERGKIVERGTHEELWELSGKYAQLVAKDSEEEHS